MSKHTKGPWRVGANLTGICTDNGDDFTANGWAKCVAKVTAPEWMGSTESFHNAKLIAAAPRLFDLVKLVHESFGGGRTITFSDLDINEFAAVIAQIEGETK